MRCHNISKKNTMSEFGMSPTCDIAVDSNMNSSKVADDSSESDNTDIALTPHIENKDAALTEMLRLNYGLNAIAFSPLNGYEDLNFHVKAAPTFTNPHIESVPEEGYFLKISNINDSIRPDLLQAQRDMMDHMTEKGIRCQDAVRGVDGKVFTPITSPDRTGKKLTYLVSLRNYLPGRVIQGLPLSPKLLFNLGVFVAKVTEAYKDFSHPYYETHDCLWSLDNMPKVSKCVFAVKDDNERKMSEEIIQAFGKQVLPLRNQFIKRQVHGDLNNHNILVSEDDTGAFTEVSGLLDFQDSVRSCLLYDFAICIAYMIMADGAEMPLTEIPGHLLAGFTSVLDLPQAEIGALRVCVAARMVMSLVYGAYSYQRDPTNEYLLDTSRFGWKALVEFWTADVGKMQARWWDIVRAYKATD